MAKSENVQPENIQSENVQLENIQSEHFQSETVQLIASEGDVMLKVGSEPCTRLRVSSATLASVSPVFRVLFSPRFCEGGLARSSHAPVEIGLPADEGRSMSDLCSLIHHKVPDALKQPDAASSCAIYNLAVAADKYACVDVLSLQAAGILLKYKVASAVTHPFAMCDLAAAAYLFDEPTSLNFFAWQLVGWVPDSFASLRKRRPSAQMLPATFWLALEEKRNAARTILLKTLPELGNPVCEKHGCDNYDAKFVEHLSTNLEQWPPHFDHDDTSILGAAFAIGKLPDAYRQRPSCSHTGARTAVSTLHFRAVADSLRSCCGGELCLRCMRTGQIEGCEHRTCS